MPRRLALRSHRISLIMFNDKQLNKFMFVFQDVSNIVYSKQYFDYIGIFPKFVLEKYKKKCEYYSDLINSMTI